jgi:hypothetical protein
MTHREVEALSRDENGRNELVDESHEAMVDAGCSLRLAHEVVRDGEENDMEEDGRPLAHLSGVRVALAVEEHDPRREEAKEAVVGVSGSSEEAWRQVKQGSKEAKRRDRRSAPS